MSARQRARRRRCAAALEAAKVVVVAGHGGPTLAYADVVLPAAVQHERHGTVTNIEGRVTNVTAKIVAPGSAWPDVAIAAELAEACGQSLGLDSVELKPPRSSKRRRATRRSRS
jgi:predicted molibdopterin-dependent oxidoreductase YjgC